MTDIQSARLTIGQGHPRAPGAVALASPQRPVPHHATADSVTISAQAKSRLQNERRPLDAELVELPAEHLAVKVYREASSRMAAMTLGQVDADEDALEGEFTVESGSMPNEDAAFIDAMRTRRLASQPVGALISDGADVYSPPPPRREAADQPRTERRPSPMLPGGVDPVRTYQTMAGELEQSRPSRGVFLDAWS